MLISEMEALLKSLDGRVENLDLRVGRIEQILPTLATKAELRHEIRGVKVLIEDVRGDVRQLAESTEAGFTAVHQRIDAETAGLSSRMDDGFGALGSRMDGLDYQMGDMRQQMGNMQRQMGDMHVQMGEVLRQLGEVFRRLDSR